MSSGKSSRSSSQVGLYGWPSAHMPHKPDDVTYPVLPKRQRDHVGRLTIRYLGEDELGSPTAVYRAVAEEISELQRLNAGQYELWYGSPVVLFASSGYPLTVEFQAWELEHLPLLIELAGRKMSPVVACALSVRHPEAAARVADEVLEYAWSRVQHSGFQSEKLLMSELLADLPYQKIGARMRDEVIRRALNRDCSEVRQRAMRLLEIVEGTAAHCEP